MNKFIRIGVLALAIVGAVVVVEKVRHTEVKVDLDVKSTD